MWSSSTLPIIVYCSPLPGRISAAPVAKQQRSIARISRESRSARKAQFVRGHTIAVGRNSVGYYGLHGSKSAPLIALLTVFGSHCASATSLPYPSAYSTHTLQVPAPQTSAGAPFPLLSRVQRCRQAEQSRVLQRVASALVAGTRGPGSGTAGTMHYAIRQVCIVCQIHIVLASERTPVAPAQKHARKCTGMQTVQISSTNTKWKA